MLAILGPRAWAGSFTAFAIASTVFAATHLPSHRVSSRSLSFRHLDDSHHFVYGKHLGKSLMVLKAGEGSESDDKCVSSTREGVFSHVLEDRVDRCTFFPILSPLPEPSMANRLLALSLSWALVAI